MEYDVVVVGAGPAGLATAIRLKQLAAEQGKEISVGVLEKGSRARRAHPLGRGDGPARDDRAAPELEGAGRAAEPAGDRRRLPVPHRDRRACARPTACVPDCFHNDGNYVISLGNVVQLAGAAGRGAGRRDLPRLRRRRSAVQRRRLASRAWPPATWASARTASRPRTSSSAWSCMRKYTMFAEGARGHLGKQLIAQFKLDDGRDPQSYAHRRQGAVGSRPGQGQARPGRAHRRLADGHATPTAAASSTTSRTTRSRSASWSAWTTRTRG